MLKEEFISKTISLDLIDETVLAFFAKGDTGSYNQISKWTKEGWLLRISKGRYVLSWKKFGQRISLEALAGRIVPDSYVSLTSVLAVEGLIPDVHAGKTVTSITCRKPRNFRTSLGYFFYRHIKPGAYGGFRVEKDSFGKFYKRATVTKALLDTLYLDASSMEPSVEFLEEGLRLQRVEKIQNQELLSYLGKFSKKMDRWIGCILEFKQQEVEG